MLSCLISLVGWRRRGWGSRTTTKNPDFVEPAPFALARLSVSKTSSYETRELDPRFRLVVLLVFWKQKTTWVLFWVSAGLQDGHDS